MNKSLHCLLLASLMLPACVMAAESTVCTSICATEQRACRANAARLSSIDTGQPFASMQGSRDARALGKLQATPQQDKAAQQDEFRKRSREREDACASAAQSCTRACAAPASMTPKTQQ
jgi:hypothetical protein